jgi:carbon storage regulator
MLVLTRKRGEALLVGEARITIEAVRGEKVRLGIQAPDHIRIDREEVDAARTQELAARTANGGRP